MNLKTTLLILPAVLLIGCNAAAPTNVPSTEAPSATPQTAKTESGSQSAIEAGNVIPFDEMGIVVGFDTPEGFAQGIVTSFNGAYTPNAPYDLPYPQNAQVIFTSHPGGSDFTVNGLRVFRADEVSALETGAVESLNAVLEGQTDHHLDFPRLAGAGSIIDAQLIALAFQNGNGYRYLLAKSFSADPINSTQLTYMYQGVSGDGKFFVSFIMLVDAPFLAPYVGQALTAPEDFETYFQTVNNLVETSGADQFAPSLTALDDFVMSLTILEK